MPYKPGDNIYLSFTTQDGTATAVNADSTPTGTLRRNGANSAQSVTVTNNATGDYTASAAIPLPWSGGDLLEMIIAATVKGVAGKAVFGLGALERGQQDSARVYLNVAGTVWFVSTAGNDSNDGKSWITAFATIAKAISVASAGDVIDVGPGTFALGNAVLNLPDRVSLIGAGPRRTTITSTAVLTSLGAIVKPGNNSVVAHLGIVAVGSSVFQAEFGFHTGATTPQTTASNWLLDDVYLEGDTDGVYLRDTSTTPTQLRGTVRNCVIRTKYDCFTTIAGGAWDLVVDLVGFNDFRALGPSVAGSAAGASRSLAIFSGMTRAFGGYYEASGSPNENYAIAVRDGLSDASARAEIYGGYLVSSGTNALDAYNNAGTLILSGAQYDQSKTSGAITLRYAPELLAAAQSFNNTGQTTPLPSTTGFTGPNTVTLSFRDSGNNPVAGVIFTVVGVGSAAADGSGNKTVSLAAGTYTVRASPTSGVLFADTTINVTTSATFTITGTALSITPASAPGQTTAYLTTRDGQGNTLAGVALTFQLIDPQTTTDSYDQTAFTATSDNSALLQVPLIKNTKYQARVGGGTWVAFTTGNGLTYALPEVLGTYSL
jgi:hypothetical protein